MSPQPPYSSDVARVTFLVSQNKEKLKGPSFYKQRWDYKRNTERAKSYPEDGIPEMFLGLQNMRV